MWTVRAQALCANELSGLDFVWTVRGLLVGTHVEGDSLLSILHQARIASDPCYVCIGGYSAPTLRFTFDKNSCKGVSCHFVELLEPLARST